LRSSIPVKFRVTVTDTPVSETLYCGCANSTVAATGEKERKFNVTNNSTTKLLFLPNTAFLGAADQREDSF
jgi:hypothetical protein